MPRNWWEMYPEVVPSPAARPRPLPGPGGVMPGPAMASQAGFPNAAIDPFQGPPSAFDPSYFAGDADLDPVKVQSPFPGDDGAPPMDRGAVIQQAAAAIQRGADPDAVHARLIQMGQGGQEPPSPFSDLMPGDRAGTIGDSAPSPMSAQPAFEDQGGFAPRAAAPGFAQGRLGNLPQRLDPRLAPQKAGGLQKSAQQKGGAGDPGDGQVGRGTPPLARLTETRPSAANPVIGGEIKSSRPVSRPDVHVGFSSPRTGGPRNPLPGRSYSVRPYRLGGGINGNGYVPQGGDAQLLARAIYSEFRDTPQDMLAGGWSIVNRVGFRNNGRLAFGHTLTDVVFQPAGNRHQYSFLDDGGSAAWRESANPSSLTGPNQAAWSRAVSIANAILSSRASDPSGGAHYFFASPTYVAGDRDKDHRPPSNFGDMIDAHHYVPTPYQSASTHRDRQGRLVRNYFFSENPEKLMDPQRRRGGQR